MSSRITRTRTERPTSSLSPSPRRENVPTKHYPDGAPITRVENVDTFQMLEESTLQIRNRSNVTMFFSNNVNHRALILFDHIALETQRDRTSPATVAYIQ